ncbi:MAG: hypothetical protein ACI93R_003124 [Flavobacteriales bacterium]|jgi:hypothetical protein
MKKIIAILLFSSSLIACQLMPPYQVTEKSFIVIFNQLNEEITLTNTTKAGNIHPITIPSNSVEFAYDYEAKSKTSPIPLWFSKITLFHSGCTLQLLRKDLEEHMVRDSQRLSDWNLYVNDALIGEFGCM